MSIQVENRAVHVDTGRGYVQYRKAIDPKLRARLGWQYLGWTYWGAMLWSETQSWWVTSRGVTHWIPNLIPLKRFGRTSETCCFTGLSVACVMVMVAMSMRACRLSQAEGDGVESSRSWWGCSNGFVVGNSLRRINEA